MDPELLAAVLRGKGHSNVEYPFYLAISLGRKLPANFGHSLYDLLEIWEARKLPCERDDIQWCYQILNLFEQYVATDKLQIINPPASFSKVEQ
jgi:hypothetical protein